MIENVVLSTFRHGVNQLKSIIDKREKGLETEANSKMIRATAGCKVDAHAQ